MLIQLIEGVYRLLWGDLLTLHLGSVTLTLSFMVILLLTAGVFFPLRTRLLPVRLFRDMLAAVCEKNDKGKGLSSFQTLVVSTATRVGMGNLVGVVAAVSVGGAGAVFWMWVTALLGASTSFVESALAQKYKQPDPLYGGWRGGPAYYIHTLAERRRGRKLRRSVTACLFAVSGLICWCGISQVVSNSVSEAFQNAFAIPPLTTTLVLTALAAVIVLRKEATVRSLDVIVPIMAGCYFVMTLWIILTHLPQLPGVFARIFSEAFGLRQAVGGGFGAVVMNGIKRGLFSNEAGSGSAPCAAAAAECDDPVKMGLVQALGVLIDTIVICSCTAFVMLLAPGSVTGGRQGMDLLQAAMEYHLGGFGVVFIAVTLALFSFSTFLGILYYAPLQCGLPLRRPLALADGLQGAGAGDAGGGRHGGLHRGVGPRRCGHRPHDHLQYAGPLPPVRRGPDRPAGVRSKKEAQVNQKAIGPDSRWLSFYARCPSRILKSL